MINFPYKIFQIQDFLTRSEFEKLQTLVAHFYIPFDSFKCHYKSLSWSKRVEEKLIELEPDFYNSILKKEYLNYNDFSFLNEFNQKFGFSKEDYFNFCMMYRQPFNSNEENTYFFNTEIEELYKKAYKNILEHLFDKELNLTKIGLNFGHINVYPKNSFIKDHTDETLSDDRLFTTLFFINSNRTIDDGSLLKIFTDTNIIEIIPDFTKIVILEQKKYNYRHEVTINLSDRVRYSIYTPLNTELYKQYITK